MKLIEWPYYREEFLKSQSLSITFPARFWAKVNVAEGCWLWIATMDSHGYGRIGRGSRECGAIAAHVASWTLHNGAVPKGFCVLHACDVPACVRPDHLWIGTQADNVRDMFRKGRNKPWTPPDNRGERQANSKLTEAAVRSILALLAAGRTNASVARQFGVCRSNISLIRHGHRWLCVDPR